MKSWFPAASNGTVDSPVRAALLDALSVLVPVDCAGCGVPDRALCDSCRLQLVTSLYSQRLSDGTVAVASLRYDGVVRRSILSFKENGRTDVGRACAAPLADAVTAALHATATTGPVELALVPTSRTSYRRRGYDPVRLLTRQAGLRAPVSALVNLRDRAAQKSLDREARVDNLAGSMRAVRTLTGHRFLLIDDVTTTGATLVEAARALRAAGAEVIAAATLAYTPRLSLGM